MSVQPLLHEPALAELRTHGYHLLRGLLAPREVTRLLAETRRLIARAPVEPGGARDAHGAPVAHPDDYVFPLDPDGEPVLNRIRFPMWRSRVFLEAYANPRILRAALQLYGEMMVPFDESIVLKMPDHGAGFAWHQDGAFKTGAAAERGHNFGIYLTPSNAGNGALHVLPGSHRQGILDLQAMVEQHGFALPGSVLAAAQPGDANLHSRSLAHGSQPNASPELRVTWYVGFHHLDTIRELWDRAVIQDRLNLIPIAVEARKRSGRYPDEEPFPYHALGLALPDSPADRERALRAPALQI